MINHPRQATPLYRLEIRSAILSVGAHAARARATRKQDTSSKDTTCGLLPATTRRAIPCRLDRHGDSASSVIPAVDTSKGHGCRLRIGELTRPVDSSYRLETTAPVRASITTSLLARVDRQLTIPPRFGTLTHSSRGPVSSSLAASGHSPDTSPARLATSSLRLAQCRAAGDQHPAPSHDRPGT